MNASPAQTPAFERLLELTKLAAPVVEHPNFRNLFKSPLLGELGRDGHQVLARFLAEPAVLKYDHMMLQELEARKTGEPWLLIGNPASDWLEGLGAIKTRSSLEVISDDIYTQDRLDGNHVRTLREGLRRLMDEVSSHARQSGDEGKELAAVAKRAKEALSESQLREVDAILFEASASLANITKKEELADKTLGKIGDLELAKYYSDFAKKESSSADSFRQLTVWMVMVAMGVTLAFVLAPAAGIGWLDLKPGDYVHLIQRAVFVGAVFGLAGYFARQAGQHRALGNWASSLAVQLHTFDAYLAAIENAEVRDTLRMSFGARVFGEHPAAKGEPSVAPSSAAFDSLAELASKLAGGNK